MHFKAQFVPCRTAVAAAVATASAVTFAGVVHAGSADSPRQGDKDVPVTAQYDVRK